MGCASVEPVLTLLPFVPASHSRPAPPAPVASFYRLTKFKKYGFSARPRSELGTVMLAPFDRTTRKLRISGFDMFQLVTV